MFRLDLGQVVSYSTTTAFTEFTHSFKMSLEMIFDLFFHVESIFSPLVLLTLSARALGEQSKLIFSKTKPQTTKKLLLFIFDLFFHIKSPLFRSCTTDAGTPCTQGKCSLFIRKRATTTCETSRARSAV